jgi:TolB-like protein
VTVRNSSFHFEGKAPTTTDLRREFNVAYVLEGSVRKAGGF